MIIKEKIVIAPYQCERTLHIYMPDKKEENERFPVHLNIFSSPSFYHKLPHCQKTGYVIKHI